MNPRSPLKVLLAAATAVCACALAGASPLRAQTNERGLRTEAAGRAEAGVRTERRVALVIGNAAYADSPLLNPVNDARDMARALRELQFEVIYGEDLSQNDMKRLVRSFGEKMSGDGIALFYYAGHGVQVEGRNYLIPARATITKEEEVEYEAVDVGFVLAQLRGARNRLNIVILDACRNNPYARSFRSVKSGLASIDAPGGTIIAYATAPGSVASDGGGRNGLYTLELLGAMRLPGAKIEDVFKRVRLNVQTKTGGRQIPWESSSLVGDFYFREGGGPGGVVAASPPAPAAETYVPPTSVDRTDPKATAAAILRAYRARDFLTLADLSTVGNRVIFGELVTQGAAHPRYRSLVSGWRWQAVQAWGGQLGEVRYRKLVGTAINRVEAHVKFGELSSEEYAVVTLIWTDGKWCFEDIHSPDRKDFEARDTVMPQ